MPTTDGDGKRKPRPIVKRRRGLISCTECHRRKQKCNRELPCANCRSRHKQPVCMYEPGAAPTAAQQKIPGTTSPQSRPRALDAAPGTAPTEGKGVGELSSIGADWGYAQNGSSTMGLLWQLDSADGRPGAAAIPSAPPMEDDIVLREKYKWLIRQLPPKNFVVKLVEMYLKGFNWQYYPIDPDIFFEQLEEWNNLSHKVLFSSGLKELSEDLRAFPAVLFQMIATALLLLPEGPDSMFDSLKYAADVRFEDLAADYSESGAAVVTLLGKTRVSFVTVQAQFLRASFLKFTAHVTEAWHTISMAIRDAQELGMHRDSMDPVAKDSSDEGLLQNRWLVERRRKMFTLLAVWDLNCALVLGRPGTVDWNLSPPTPPIDAPIPTDRSATPVVPRDKARDPPTPVTRILWSYQLCGPLRDIQNLEKDGPRLEDWTKVDRVHQNLIDLESTIPPAFRLDNPDTRWDDRPELDWLQAARFYFAQLHQFGYMALHRPYVLSRKKSRSEAIQASLRMLEVQKMTFQGLPPDSYRNFLLFYGSFDAIVLIASVYLLFPHEHPELIGSVSQHFQWTIERFSAIRDRNPLAKSAQGVLRAIVAKFRNKFREAISVPAPVPTSEEQGSASDGSDWKAADFWATAMAPTSLLGVPSENLLKVEDPSEDPQPSLENGWTLPSMDNLASVAPIFPTSDLIYHDLNATQVFMPSVGEEPVPEEGDQAWQFEGDWVNATVWQLLNQMQRGGDWQQ